MHLEYLLDVEARLQSRMKNPRKVKRYLADIQSKLTIVDLVWFQDENPGKMSIRWKIGLKQYMILPF